MLSLHLLITCMPYKIFGMKYIEISYLCSTFSELLPFAFGFTFSELEAFSPTSKLSELTSLVSQRCQGSVWVKNAPSDLNIRICSRLVASVGQLPMFHEFSLCLLRNDVGNALFGFYLDQHVGIDRARFVANLSSKPDSH